ncbi:MAG: 30S ribosomal protein S18 [Phycisphaerae bacterium]|jgi:small subunit ribosomal protein S18|nr:30S ribosomal protein S18 [Phycisphaerae bacterium]MDP7636213.1 30S ribosomal protein S18 [Phycisphaerae bacterium]
MARKKKIMPRIDKPVKRKKRNRFHEQAKCRFCRDKIQEVDYKDIATLNKLTTQQGKIYSIKRSGNCARHQRSCRQAIKRARFLALMPFVG